MDPSSKVTFECETSQVDVHSEVKNGSEDKKTESDGVFSAIAEEKRSRKATKSDDAAIPIHL